MRYSIPLCLSFCLVSCAQGNGLTYDASTVNDSPASQEQQTTWDGQQTEDGPGKDLPVTADLPAKIDQGVKADTSAVDTQQPDSCVPSCGGKVCGGDGCGGSCGTCPAWETCSGGTCNCLYPLPSGWPSSFPLSPHNPIMVATTADALQGQDNIYAPDLQPLAGGWAMWYGGQGSDGHDRIFLATSKDAVHWRKWPADSAPKAALDHGSSNHVNDPSVVRVGSTWYMYYTDAPVGIDDRIWLAQSTTLTGFKKVQQVLGPGPAGSWESLKVGRPAVLYEGGVFKMWYDGQDGTSRHVGYATSTDGKTFVRHASNPVFKNAGAVDVKKVGGVYVMLRESGQGTYWATSKDGIHCWKNRGQLFGKSGKPYDAHGQVTPFLQVVSGQVKAVWFGGAKVSTWNENRIAVAYPSGTTVPAGGGCTACVPAGWSCSAACQNASAGAKGTCGAPGSTNPSACCACSTEGCEACTGSFPDCHAACAAIAGIGGGYCAHPGSTNPGVCCACW